MSHKYNCISHLQEPLVRVYETLYFMYEIIIRQNMYFGVSLAFQKPYFFSMKGTSLTLLNDLLVLGHQDKSDDFPRRRRFRVVELRVRQLRFPDLEQIKFEKKIKSTFLGDLKFF